MNVCAVYLFYLLRYRPQLPVEFVQQILAFDSLDACLAFLVEAEVTLTADHLQVDCKSSSAGSWWLLLCDKVSAAVRAMLSFCFRLMIIVLLGGARPFLFLLKLRANFVAINSVKKIVVLSEDVALSTTRCLACRKSNNQVLQAIISFQGSISFRNAKLLLNPLCLLGLS